MNKVWLVTGSASGLGRNIAEAVLESGDRLVVETTKCDNRRLQDTRATKQGLLTLYSLGPFDAHEPLSHHLARVDLAGLH
jgi:NAD(P)-dependent dehydrogenase (short-subunit alcohol dehydrogenase family)